MRSFALKLFIKILASAAIIAATVMGASEAPWWLGLFFAGLLAGLCRVAKKAWLIPLWLSALVLLGTNFASAGMGAVLGVSLVLLWVPRMEDTERSVLAASEITLIGFLGFFQPFLYGYLPGHCLLAFCVPVIFAFVGAPYRGVVSFLALSVEAIFLAANLELMFPAICGAICGPGVAEGLLGAKDVSNPAKSASSALVGEEK